MSTLQPIDRQAWEGEGQVVPTGPERESEELPDELTEGDSYWAANEEPVEFKGRYVVVVAIRGPERGASPRYFAVSLPAEYQAGKVLGRAVGAPLQALETALAPLGQRLKNAWDETTERFVTLDELAGELEEDPEVVATWRALSEDFPPSVMERKGDPLFVRAEVEDWLRDHGKR